MQLFLDEPFSVLWEQSDPFVEAFHIEGECYRDMGDRRTSRFVVDNKGYFIKTHSGVGFREIIKNLVFLRLPVLGAENEYRAIGRLHELGVDTMQAVGFGRQGLLPTSQKSFLITEALEPAQPLDEYLSPEILKKLGVRERRALARKLGKIARTLHSQGVNHRDFYLCHFLLDTSAQYADTPPSQRPVYLIDLHRVQIRKRVPGRWRRKDIAGLLYSSRLVGFDHRDALCFLREYDQKPLKESLRNRRFWDRVLREADKLFEKGERKGYHD